MPGTPPPKKGLGAGGIVGIVVGALALVCLLGVGALVVIGNLAGDEEPTATPSTTTSPPRPTDLGWAVGGCVTATPYKTVACTSSTAKYVILQTTAVTEMACRYVAGAEVAYATGGVDYCLGLKGVDPSTDLRRAQLGDCAHMTGNVDTSTKVPCSSSSATHQVIRIFQNFTGNAANACAGVSGATYYYGWNWETSVDVYTDILCFKDA